MSAEEDCIFCKIAAGQLPAEKITEDGRTVAFMDINPWTRGHALVIPKRHSRNLYEIEPADLSATLETAQDLARKMRDRLSAEGVNLINSCEPAAWQTVFHFHVHVIPRWSDDPLRLPGTPREPDEGELAEVAEELR